MMNVMVKITADITDSQENVLYRLDDLAEGALGAWGKLLKNNIK